MVAQETVQQLDTSTEEVVVTYRDKVALKISKKIYFLSELNQVIKDLKKIKCLKESLLFNSIGHKQNLSLEITPDFNTEQQVFLKKFSIYLILLNHIQGLGISAGKVEECKNSFTSNKNIQDFFLVESYLRSRFITPKGLDDRGLKVFLDTTFQKVFYEQLL